MKLKISVYSAYRYQNSPGYEGFPYKLKIIQTLALFTCYFKVQLRGHSGGKDDHFLSLTCEHVLKICFKSKENILLERILYMA